MKSIITKAPGHNGNIHNLTEYGDELKDRKMKGECREKATSTIWARKTKSGT